ncbi:MAG: hypothetical protein CBC35_07425 [Planctomycetes bacterium TMED75]|nr:hypothetical protein [Planctomycetaceae bacterium]OUU92327.1 MAG: hypothetical protein CBC35_07425 [Planctomycetes bacterium TMED75]
MALGSQSRQQVGRNRYMYRRRKGRSGKWIGALAALIGCGIVLWFLVPQPRSSQAKNPSTELNQPAQLPIPRVEPEPTRTARANSLLPTTPVQTIESSAMKAEPAREVVSNPAEIESSTPVSRAPKRPSEPRVLESIVTATQPTEQSSRIEALKKSAQLDPLAARMQLSQLVASETLGPGEAMEARKELNRLAGVLLFDPSVLPQDPFVDRYVVQPGDSLSRIARNTGVKSEWTMIKRINQITNPNSIRVGQSLKIPVGTFHARVSKQDYRLDLFLENEHGRVLVASCPVGLGEFDATPTGRFVVREQSKLVNPQWRNPRTGEFFYSDDPENPIGERWIGIKGIDQTNSDLLGYGIHGTIDEESIGQMHSMGCIRMNDADVKLVYDALTERGSIIEIVP